MIAQLTPVISEKLGLQDSITRVVHGGDINQAFQLLSRNERFFVKVNDADRYEGMFEKEAIGLDLLRQGGGLKIPEVILTGKYAGVQFLVLEWLEKGNFPGKDGWQMLAQGLAKQHQIESEFAGLDADNYIGSLLQPNARSSNWPEFYREQRIMPLVKLLFDNGAFDKHELKEAAILCNQFENILPVGPFSLLHGDLWGGNFLFTADGKPSVYDPAVYYGHREMDIGLTKLFGGFDSRFYEVYHECYPLEKGWKERLPIVQLYPLLVHAVLFKGGYALQCKNIIAQYC